MLIKEEFGKDVQVLFAPESRNFSLQQNTVEEIGVLFDGVISKIRETGKKERLT